MSSMKTRNKAIKREHRERPQIKERANLGLLEKKKDWIKRARDFQEKRDKIRELREVALSKNPDEFYHHMIRSQIGRDGIHRDFDMDQVLGKDAKDSERNLKKDLCYVTFKLVNEKKKIDKLKGSLHLATIGRPINKRIVYQDDSDDDGLIGIVEESKVSLPDSSQKLHEMNESYKLLAEKIKKVKELEIVKRKLEKLLHK
ncbi:Probable U3 small nucleolar RNA-associated protein 11 [Strongyloides ratti]|uniref:Probable U3 small nucleolar RNA-associated protein 11 n=1 Tax=Strongyloides ratti TaxID=34506 RepID=A0A090LM70_STRRB|nr:Probable U3 small nucleolar RNA-associated protein 11 [Strongyloides ratti]CEF68645.1 Probable U3 small nucleolar RNA-associated protein 11 [Strongyloides ratti]